MNISSVNSGSATQSLQRTPEASEVKKGGRDRDGDSDDGGAAAVQSAPLPTINSSGQKIGQIINVKA